MDTAFYDRVEYWLSIGRRAADDSQDLCRGRLLFERFSNFSVARLELLEQPHVLDRDHGLGGEGLDQRDLLFRERPRRRAGYIDRPNNIVFPQHRHTHDRAKASLFGSTLELFTNPVLREDVQDVHHLPAQNGPGGNQSIFIERGESSVANAKR
ncbi:MAG TPA: hypothetical protein VLA73_10700 [Burkholderiales bacterium]|nr:hypothetical protein [Burkholderiales bacterium]